MSFTGPDLDVGKDAIESLMDDTCRITRGVPDSARVLDRGTGKVAKPAPAVVYEGACKAKQDLQPSAALEGGDPLVIATYIVAIPMTDGTDAHEPIEGDMVEYLTCRRDPGLVGQFLRVANPVWGTFALQRMMKCELRRSVVDRP